MMTRTLLYSIHHPRSSPVAQFLLEKYHGNLPVTIAKILQFGTLVGYAGPDSLIISKNQESVYLALEIIDAKLRDDLAVGRIIPASQSFPFISSPLGLVPKHDGAYTTYHTLARNLSTLASAMSTRPWNIQSLRMSCKWLGLQGNIISY
jgi:hypothetical protein